MDEVITSILQAVTAGGWAAVAVAIGWFGHKVVIAGLICWSAVRAVERVMNVVIARITTANFIERVACAAGKMLPLSPEEEKEILRTLSEAARK